MIELEPEICSFDHKISVCVRAIIFRMTYTCFTCEMANISQFLVHIAAYFLLEPRDVLFIRATVHTFYWSHATYLLLEPRVEVSFAVV